MHVCKDTLYLVIDNVHHLAFDKRRENDDNNPNPSQLIVWEAMKNK